MKKLALVIGLLSWGCGSSSYGTSPNTGYTKPSGYAGGGTGGTQGYGSYLQPDGGRDAGYADAGLDGGMP